MREPALISKIALFFWAVLAFLAGSWLTPSADAKFWIETENPLILCLFYTGYAAIWLCLVVLVTSIFCLVDFLFFKLFNALKARYLRRQARLKAQMATVL